MLLLMSVFCVSAVARPGRPSPLLEGLTHRSRARLARADACVALPCGRGCLLEFCSGLSVFCVSAVACVPALRARVQTVCVWCAALRAARLSCSRVRARRARRVLAAATPTVANGIASVQTETKFLHFAADGFLMFIAIFFF